MRRVRDWVNNTGFTAHLVRARERYRNRLGAQFAGSITFFSVLAMVPILMLAFGALGLTLTVIKPEWLDGAREVIVRNLADGALRDQVLSLVDRYLYNWQAISVFAAIAAVGTGAIWSTNLKAAVRGLWRPEFDLRERPRHGALVEYAINFAILLALLVLGFVALIANAMSSTLAADLVDLVGLDGTFLDSEAVRALSLVINLFGAWCLFMFLYWALPEERAQGVAIRRGSLIAAVLFYFLQTATTSLSGILNEIFGQTLFGPLLLSMLFLSFFARLILVMAAWIATANQPAIARRYLPADEMLRGEDGILAVDGHWEAAERDQQRRVEQPEDDELVGPLPDAPAADVADLEAKVKKSDAEAEQAHQEAAQATAEAEQARSRFDRLRGAWTRARTEEGTGLAFGLGAGLGLGALLATLLSRLTRRP